MTYLLAKFTLFFLLAAALGFLLGYWFSRRNIEDVSESFEELRKANDRSDDQNWEHLWGQLRAIPEPSETDLTDVYRRLDRVTTAVSQLPKPQAVDFQPLNDRLNSIESDIKAIPVPPTPERINFSPLTGKIEAMQAALRSIPKPEPQRDVDLTPMQNEISTLRDEIRGIPAVETHAPVDLRPFDQRLKAIETELGRLGKQIARPAKVERSTRREPQREPGNVSQQEPRILKAALYGKKDNLRLISGVGPKLENLLNENGVFYFWQVAEWNNHDIEIIDERLDVFKGRIGRDKWVDQAKQLRGELSAARMPTGL